MPPSETLTNRRYGRKPTEDPGVRGAIAARLVELRKNAGLTQIEASESLGRPKSWIGKLETGRRSLLFSEASRLCELYGAPLADLEATGRTGSAG